MRQQRILLRATETMKLINEEKCLLTMGPTLRCSGNRLAHLCHAIACCREARWNGAHGGSNDCRKR